MWKDNYTSGDIADTVKISRGAVMGILHRARKRGLVELRPVVLKEKGTAPKRERVKRLKLPSVFDCAPIPEPEPIEIPAEEPAPEITSDPVHFLDARYEQCRWIVGRAPDNFVLFCGVVTREGLSYCVAHRKLVYVPHSKTKKLISSTSLRNRKVAR